MPRHNRKRKNQQYQQNRNNNQNATKRNKQNKPQPERQQSQGSTANDPEQQHGKPPSDSAAVGTVGPMPNVDSNDLVKNGSAELHQNDGATPRSGDQLEELHDEGATGDVKGDESEFDHRIDLAKTELEEAELSTDQHDPISNVSDQSYSIEEEQRSNDESIELVDDHSNLSSDRGGVVDTKTGANESTGNGGEGNEVSQPPSDQGAIVELKTIEKKEIIPEPPDKSEPSKEEVNIDSTVVEIGTEPIKGCGGVSGSSKDRKPLEPADSIDSTATTIGSDILDNDEEDTGNLPDISDFSAESIDNIVEGDIMRDDTQSNICDKEVDAVHNDEDPQTVPRKSSKSPSPALSTSSSATLVGEKEEMDQNADAAEENRDTVSSGERTMTTTTTTTREIPLKHGLVQEIIQTTSTYRVESPKPIVTKTTTTTTVKKSRSLGDDIFAIQELSDCSSTSELNDYQPVVSEASESEAESEVNETYEIHQHPSIISVQTIPINHPEMRLESASPNESQDDLKTRRAKKRMAIETHFMPQFLNPRYLDSIREESEHSDADRKSNDSGDLKRSPTEDDLDDDVFHSPTSPKHAVNAVYPKSHLDFSKKHQAPPLPQPSTSSIREESVRVVLEAKLFDQPVVLESCSEWQTDKIPESDAAEVIYIDSASSSSSDVVDPDDVEVIEEDQNVRIHTPTIESNQVDSLLNNSSMQTSTIEKSNNSMTSEVKTAQIERSILKSEAPPVAREKQESRENEERKFINENLHQPNQGQHENHGECGAKNYDDHLKLDNENRASAAARTGSIPKDHSVQTPATPSVSAINSNIPESSSPGNQQEILIKTTAIKVQLKNIIESTESEVKRVEETVSSESSVTCDRKETKNLSEQSTMYSSVINPLVQSHDEVIRKLAEEPDPGDGSNAKDFARQDSSGSHCSGNSQNTVINKDTTTSDLSDFDVGQCPISGSPKQATAPISPASPTLRQLCLETLASMPYGYAVLEELANVSETISDLTQIHQEQQLQQHENKDDMPYPLPEIPKINDLEVRMHENDAKTYARASSSGKVRLVTLPPQPVPGPEAKLKSPPPPPVPEQPKMEPWLGLPTEQDPNVLVCLSPSQRNYMNETSKSGSKPADTSADSLLDMHKKFVERRGYHEYTSEQVKATQRSEVDKSILVSTPPTNVTTTSKPNSQSPPPIPPPPLPRNLGQTESKPPQSPSAPIPPPKSSSTATLAAKTLKSDDKNNHRLLAIIRDSKQPSGESAPKEIRHEIVVEESSDQQTQQNRISQQVQTEKLSAPPSAVPPPPPTKSAETSSKMLPPLPEIEAQIRALQQLAQGKSITEEKTEIKRSETKTETKSTASAPQTYFNKPSWHRDSFFSSLDDLRKKCEGFDRSDSSRRFSSFDVGTPFCSQIMQTMPKRYSNIEKSSFESKKRVENGNVIYDITDSKQEKVVDDGEGGVVKESSSSHTGETPKAEPSQASATAPKEEAKSSNYFTEFFKNRTSAETPKTQPQSAPAPSTTGARPSSMFSFFGSQKQKTEEKPQTQNFAYDEFRERAKESARRAQSEFFDRDIFNFKDFEQPKSTFKDDFFSSTSTSEKKEENVHKEYRIPIKVESQNEIYEPKQQQQHKTQNKFQAEPKREPAQEPLHREHRIPIQVEGREPKRASSVMDNRSDYYSEHKTENQNEWMNFADTTPTSPLAAQTGDLGASSENITKPIQKEFEICRGRRANIRAPRLSVSTSNLTEYDSHDESVSGNMYQQQFYSPAMKRRQVSSMYEQPSPSLPQDPQAEHIAMKERELQAQIEKLDQDRRRLIEEMDRVHANQRMQRDHNQRMMQRLPTLNEEETFRQQIQNEWLNKVAEREERRLQNIIKISKPAHEVKPQEQYESREYYGSNSNMRKAVSAADISDEFLRRVKERRSKLCMPSDSDWESGAESQPQPSPYSEQNKLHEPPPRVKVIEGQREADIRQLPKHLREFAEFTTTRQEEHDEKTSTHRESTLIRSKDELPPEIRVTDPDDRLVPIIHNTTVTEKSVKSTITNKKQSRFRLTPNRRSWSENDLLKEIDNALVLSKGFLYGRGVWTPQGKSDPSAEGRQYVKQRTTPATPPPPPPPPVWSPQPSPQPGRKEFRPINFESPKPTRKYIQRQESDPVAPPWSYTETKPFSSSCTNLNSFGYDSRPLKTTASSSTSITSLQKAREGQIQKGVSHTELSRPKPPKDETPAFVRPNEVIYSIKHEYMSEPESYNERPKKMAQLGRRQFEGIGPTTKDGMPIVLRSEVKEDNQHKWYKRMYNTLHKAKDDDVVTIRYKTRRGRYPYKTNGYMSEPEPNYDSDYSIKMKYNTLDRRRIPSTGSFDDRSYGTMPNPVKPGSSSYKNQPGRIEDYVPGHSSISEKEKKEWWDEVMEIFNGHLEQQKLSSNYAEGYLSRALKDQGYESDSHLVFRKKEESHIAPLSPLEQKQAYRNVQTGGEPPLQGFRKPAPEKPKESPRRYIEHDVNIHYKSPVRYEYKDAIPEEELARKQAEAMKKLYQEERRRKYLQELQDMNSRRHTDNFTPSQKSPIPLNRYDDFNNDLMSPKSPGSYPKTIARALYNFQGQTARELTFKKGDIIYIRRQIDKNWYEGEHNAMIGLLPANYVEIISKDTKQSQSRKPSEGQARAKFNFSAQSAIELSLNKGELVTLTRRVDENWFEGKIANRKGIFPVSYVEVLTDIGAEEYCQTAQSKPVGAPAAHSLVTYSNQNPSLDALRTNLNNEFNNLTNGHHNPSNGILRETKSVHKTEVLHVDTNTEPVPYRALYKYRPQNNDELELHEGDIVYVLEKCDDGWYVGTSQRTGYFGTFPGNYVEKI